jgi:hypothetical protein
VSYRTRHEQCLEMLDLWGAQVPHRWVTGDDELGRHTGFRQALRERGERSVLGVPCTPSIRDLEAPLPASQGRGRRPKAPWHLVSAWRYALAPDGWTRVTVRDGEKIEMVTRRVQTRLERKRTGPHEWLVVTRHLLADEGRCAGKSSPDVRDQDARYGYRYYVTPTAVAKEDLEEPSRGNWDGSSQRAPALKPASNEARVKWAWTNIRSVPGRAGITIWPYPWSRCGS